MVWDQEWTVKNTNLQGFIAFLPLVFAANAKCAQSTMGRVLHRYSISGQPFPQAREDISINAMVEQRLSWFT